MMMKQVILFLVILLVFASGCQVLSNPQNTSDDAALPGSTLIVSSTQALPPTATSENIPTNTPRTMNQDEAKDFSYTLLASPGDCRYPCFWGITPGISSWSDAENFLRKFATNITYLGWAKIPKLKEFLVVVPVYESINTYERFSVMFLTSVDGTKVEEIAIAESNFDLIYDVFQNYGEPDEILFWSSGLTIGDPVNLIVVEYRKLNTLFIYTFDTSIYDRTGEGDAHVEICSSDMSTIKPMVHIWNNNSSENIESILDHILRYQTTFGLLKFSSLDHVTNTTVEELYLALLDSVDSDFCFQSSVEHWKR